MIEIKFVDPAAHGGERELLIGYLRQEAYAVRDCFTKYSVETTIAVGGALIAIAKFQVDVPYVGLMAIFPILLVFHVASMGIHKYGTSNRLLAYELHLHRTSHDIDRDPCHEMMKTVGWEEAMRAWRVIETNVWSKIYEPTDGIPRKLYPIKIQKSVFREVEDGIATDKANNSSDFSGFWFDQSEAYKRENVRYNAGGYLRTISAIFAFAILSCLALSYVSILQLWVIFINFNHQTDQIKNIIPSDTSGLLFINVVATIGVLVATALTLARWMNIRSRIAILETGLSSIHSSGILWEAIILAHLIALQRLEFFNKTNKSRLSMHGYSRCIAQQADEIAINRFRIHSWIDASRAALEQDIKAYLQKSTVNHLRSN